MTLSSVSCRMDSVRRLQLPFHDYSQLDHTLLVSQNLVWGKERRERITERPVLISAVSKRASSTNTKSDSFILLGWSTCLGHCRFRSTCYCSDLRKAIYLSVALFQSNFVVGERPEHPRLRRPLSSVMVVMDDKLRPPVPIGFTAYPTPPRHTRDMVQSLFDVSTRVASRDQ